MSRRMTGTGYEKRTRMKGVSGMDMRPLWVSMMLVVSIACVYGQTAGNEHEIVGNVSGGVCVADSVGKEEADSLKGIELAEVVVEQQSIVHKGSHDLVTITPSMRKNAKSISEVVGKLAGFRYNPLDRTLSYLGSPGIKFLVDSIEKSDEQIRQLGHQRFGRLDVIYNPTGKYQGYEILINLHTKENYEGYDLYALEKGSLMPSGRNGEGKDVSAWDNQFFYNHMKNRWTFGVSGNYSWTRGENSSLQSTYYPLNGIVERGVTAGGNIPSVYARRSRLSGIVSADYRINPNHTVSLSLSMDDAHTREKSLREMEQLNLITGAGSRERQMQASSSKPGFDYWGGAYYTGRKGLWALAVSMNFSDWKMNDYTRMARSSGFEIEDNRVNRRWTQIFNVDVTRRTRGDKWVFNMNYIEMYSRLTARRMGTDEKLFGSSQLSNRISASANFYASQALSVGVSGGVQWTKYDTGGNAYTTVTPRADVFAAYNLTPSSWVRLYYLVTVESPALSMVNNFSQFTDSLICERGNDHLRATTNHNVNLIFGLGNYLMIRVKGGYVPRQMNTLYGAAYGMRPDGLEGYFVESQMANTGCGSWGLRADFHKEVGKVYLGVMANAEKEYSFYGRDYSGWTYSGDVMAVYNMARLDGMGLISYHLNNRTGVGPQSVMTSHTDAWEVMLQKNFLKGHLEVSLTYVVPLHFTSGKVVSRTVSDAIVLESRSNNQHRSDNRLTLSVIYRLQKGKVVRKMKTEQLSL